MISLLGEINYFRGVFMCNQLQHKQPNATELAIINLADSKSPGSHWVAFALLNRTAFYYDSFGDLKPPSIIQDYLRRRAKKIYYNRKRHQKLSSYMCGHYCVLFIANFYMTYILMRTTVDENVFNFLIF